MTEKQLKFLYDIKLAIDDMNHIFTLKLRLFDIIKKLSSQTGYRKKSRDHRRGY